MRWIKHLAMAHADQAIALVLEKHGAEAYGIWGLILEDIAAPMEPGKMDPKASHSAVKWSQICHCSVRRFNSIAQIFADEELISMQSVDDRVTIEVSNILKYKDEYSKKSGPSRARVTDTEADGEADTDREQIKDSSASGDAGGLDFQLKPPEQKPPDTIGNWFNGEFWPLYPRKVDKQEALKACRKTLPGVKPSEVMRGLREQIPRFQAMIDSGEVERVPHASTWIRKQRWRDEVLPMTIPAASVDKQMVNRLQTASVIGMLSPGGPR